MTEPIYRYRAVKPFEEEQSMLFFGRKAETEQLASLIFSEKLTVLYGKSGYGKSSLLNAGILPRLKSENEYGQKRYVPVPVRFQAYETGGESLMEKFRFHFVLLFDQFEEFFSYPPEQQDGFKAQLSELLYTAYPSFVRENRKNLSDAELDFFSRDLDVRAVFAIRADRMSDLDQLSRPLTAILKNRMELGALSETQAEEAILRPAVLPNKGGIFKTEKFGFTPPALRQIMSALVGRDVGRIDSFVLQIVCFSIEKTAERLRLAEIGTDNLPDFREVFDTYYREQLAEMPGDAVRQNAATLLEYQLLGLNPQNGEAHRRSVDSADLGALPDLLNALEKTYLIRREINSFGRFSYEISHDTLIEPILKARKKKDAVEAERKKREELAAEAERIAREKAEAERRRRRALVTSAVAGVLILGAVGASVFAVFQSKKAGEASAFAVEKTRVSDSLATRAQDLSIFAEAAEKKAQDAIRQSGIDSENARVAIAEAKQKKLEAVEAQRLADEALKKLKQETAAETQFFNEAIKDWEERNNYTLNGDEWKTKVDTLDLSRKGLFTLPEQVFQCEKLRALDLGYNQLITLPAEIGELKNLTALYLRGNQLTALPAEIGELKNLTTLGLRDNQLTALPAEIGELKNLAILNLTENKLTVLPAEIGELKNLTELDLTGNKLTVLPAEIGGLKNLTTLDLRDNQLTALPAEIGELKNLTKLDLNSNQLTVLPAKIGELKNLTELDLGLNKLTVLPAEIGGLKNLTELYLWGNPIPEAEREKIRRMVHAGCSVSF